MNEAVPGDEVQCLEHLPQQPLNEMITDGIQLLALTVCTVQDQAFQVPHCQWHHVAVDFMMEIVEQLNEMRL